MARRKMNDRTQGLYNFLGIILGEIRKGNTEEADLKLVDLMNDIGGAYVCISKKPKKSNPVPKYDPKKDGDYSRWLVANNID